MSATPSPFGEIAAGLTPARLKASGTGADPMKPVAGRTVAPAAIVHAYRPDGIALASHSQRTSVPVPEPDPTWFLFASVTVIVHGSAVVSLA